MSNQTQVSIQELTFIIREAPIRSKFAGVLCAEVRTTERGHKITPHLRKLGLLDDLDSKINIEQVETWQHPTIGWKLFRFPVASVDPDVLYLLHEQCSQSDVEGFVLSTEKYLAEVSKPLAIDELVAQYSKQQLKDMAKYLPGYDALGKNPNKTKLATLIAAAA